MPGESWLKIIHLVEQALGKHCVNGIRLIAGKIYPPNCRIAAEIHQIKRLRVNGFLLVSFSCVFLVKIWTQGAQLSIYNEWTMSEKWVDIVVMVLSWCCHGVMVLPWCCHGAVWFFILLWVKLFPIYQVQWWGVSHSNWRWKGLRGVIFPDDVLEVVDGRDT